MDDALQRIIAGLAEAPAEGLMDKVLDELWTTGQKRGGLWHLRATEQGTQRAFDVLTACKRKVMQFDALPSYAAAIPSPDNVANQPCVDVRFDAAR